MMKTYDNRCMTHHLFNCIWVSLVYFWTLRPTAPKRSLKKNLFGVFQISKTWCLYIKRSFIWKTFLCLSFVWSSFGLDIYLHIDQYEDEYWDSLWLLEDIWDDEHSFKVNDPSISTSYTMKCAVDSSSICVCRSHVTNRLHACSYTNLHHHHNNPGTFVNS